MRDGHQILNHLLFGRQAFLVEHQDFTAIRLRVMLEPVKAESGQSVTVCEDQDLDLAATDRVHQGEKLLALEVQGAADFLDKLDAGEPSSNDELFEPPTLVGQVRPLRGAGDSAICDLSYRTDG